MELQVSILDRTTDTPRGRPCRFAGKPLVLKVARDRRLPDVFNTAYLARSATSTCTPTSFD
jgi:hypothetical protein